MTGLSKLLPLLCCLCGPPQDASLQAQSYRNWTLEEAVDVLNRSPWAQRETFTRIIEGIGSGVRGEKEILDGYFVRFLSALPIRQAYLRIQQIRNGYDGMPPAERTAFDRRTRPLLELDVANWIVVAVAFRSNDPDKELKFKQFFSTQTLETLRKTTSLSTKRFPQLDPVAFFPPDEDGVGLRLVFPRKVNGEPVVSDKDKRVTFEMQVPVGTSTLRSTFGIKAMLLDGQLIL